MELPEKIEVAATGAWGTASSNEVPEFGAVAEKDLTLPAKIAVEGSEQVEETEIPLPMDLALGIGSYGLASLALGSTGIGALGIGAAGTGIYLGAKKLLYGKNPKPMLLDKIPGFDVLPDSLLGTAEEFAMMAAAGPIVRGSGKLVKGVLKGIDWAVHTPLAPLADKAAPLGNWMWKNIAVKPMNKQLPLMNKSIAEVFQAGVERLETKLPPAAEAIRSANVEKSLVMDIGRDLGTTLSRETPEVLKEVNSGLKYLGKEVSVITNKIGNPRAQEIIAKVGDDIVHSKLDPKYEQEVFKHLRKLNLLPKGMTEEELKFVTEATGNTSQVHKFLKGVIHNPESTDLQRQYAKDLWSMHAKTPAAVASASSAAMRELLVENLARVPGAFSETVKPGYVKSEVKGLKNLIIHRDIELEFQAMDKIPKITEGLFNKYFMVPWKTSKIMLRPASHIRNLMSNVILNDWGGLPFYRMDIYMDAYKGIRANSKSFQEFKRLVGGGVSNYSIEDLAHFTRGTTYESNMVDKALNLFDKVVAPARSIYSAEESLFKYGKYLHNLENKMSIKDAAADALKWTMNFSETTPEVARLAKWVMPFARWYSKVIPLGFETAVKHPVRFAKWPAMFMGWQMAALEHHGMTDEEWNTLKTGLPEYMQKGIYALMPWRDEKKNLQLLDLTFIMSFFGDLTEMYGSGPAAAIIGNPMYTTAAALLTKKKYSSVPLYYDWEHPATKTAKSFAYMWEQVSPAVMPPFGPDWKKMYNAITDAPDSYSVEQAVANAAGFKLSPINEAANNRLKAAVTYTYDREIVGDLKKKIRTAKSDKEVAGYIEEASSARRKIRGL